MKLIDKLDMLMGERGINRMELSKRAHVPYTTIVSLYEKGYDNIKLSTLKKLSIFFHCSLDYLADDNINDRYFINSMSASESRMQKAYLKLKNSDDPEARALASAIDRILGLSEHEDEE